MNKVITVNLNGNAYQIDEDGYLALRDYLDRAEAQLRDNTDKREVIADLERAIAEKCTGLLRPHKNVVTTSEITQILSEIGPVQTPDGQTVNLDPPKSEPPMSSRFDKRGELLPRRRRLYRLEQGAKWAGVCAGLAAFSDIQVSAMRVLFVLVTIFTGLVPGIFVYVVLIFLLPVAYTQEEIAAAHARPLTARRA
jgi:phage shock protein PspC (stress-responsive transcriptional regulator)